MQVAIKALQDKGMGINESDFRDEDLVRNDQYIVIFRGEAAELFDCLFERRKDSLPAEHGSHGADVLVSHLDGGVDTGKLPVLHRSDVAHGVGKISLENVKEHATPLAGASVETGGEG